MPTPADPPPPQAPPGAAAMPMEMNVPKKAAAIHEYKIPKKTPEETTSIDAPIPRKFAPIPRKFALPTATTKLAAAKPAADASAAMPPPPKRKVGRPPKSATKLGRPPNKGPKSAGKPGRPPSAKRPVSPRNPVTLDEAAASGCLKCQKELATGEKTRKTHADHCPRKWRAAGKPPTGTPSPEGGEGIGGGVVGGVVGCFGCCENSSGESGGCFGGQITSRQRQQLRNHLRRPVGRGGGANERGIK